MKHLLRGAMLGAIVALSAQAVAADAQAISEGTIKKIDKAHGAITISHGPLANLGMPGMTMAFKAQNPAWLDKFKAGEKVRFRVEDLDGTYTIVRIEAEK
jgi:Cu(I)/Ag(I) efflux system protein CusF